MLKTIQSKIFISYSIFILLIITVFTSSFYFYISSSLEMKSSESLYALSYSINTQLDSELSVMNSLITRIWYSQTSKELFFSNIYDLSNDNLANQRKLNDVIYTAIGPDFPVSQVNIFQTNGKFFSVGLGNNYSNLTSKNILKVPWVQEVLKTVGKKYILPPHPDDWGMSDRPVISFCKASISDYSNSADTVIEIQQDYDKFAEIINRAIISTDPADITKRKVLVFNAEGQIIYPTDNSRDETDRRADFYVNLIKKYPVQAKTIRFTDSESGSKEIAAYFRSEFSDWTVVVSESEDVLLSPVNQFRNTLILAVFAILFISLFLSYFVSRSLSTPIKAIHKNIKKLSLESLPESDSLQINSGINELEELNLSFLKMCEKLKISLDEIVSSKSQEIQSRFLALQSQMNPHFLFNTISNICVMAEDNGDADVVKSCRNLTSMLRYISSESDIPVSLRQEIEHTYHFINLMKIRYEDKMVMEVNIPESILDIQIPKLVIQPLVENCTKYGVNLDPPWKINVDGENSGDRWTVTVRDNGQGFDDTYLKVFEDRLSSIDPFNHSINLKLDGMGLINIYIRLKLMYRDQAVFEISNGPQGGAMVRIGGPVKSSGRGLHEG